MTMAQRNADRVRSLAFRIQLDNEARKLVAAATGVTLRSVATAPDYAYSRSVRAKASDDGWTPHDGLRQLPVRDVDPRVFEANTRFRYYAPRTSSGAAS
jgi:hypothetical protein